MLQALKVKVTVAGRKLFDWDNILTEWEEALKRGQDAAVFTHVSNVFGYILPVEEMAALCQQYGIPFVMDAAQSAGSLPVSLKKLGADFIAMPGHKGLLGPQGTGLLLCGGEGRPLLYGGTGSESRNQEMPEFLPDRLEPGTLNVPGYAGLREGLRYLNREGVAVIGKREHRQMKQCAAGLQELGMRVFSGPHQAGTISFLPDLDSEEAADLLGKQGIAVRAGLHCAPLAHESAGTLQTGTVRVSFGYNANPAETYSFLRSVSKLPPFLK
jgi:selenocysteine lyase/cysteine desulfurase